MSSGSQDRGAFRTFEGKMIKTTGAEFKRFYSDEAFWKDGLFHEEEMILVDGENVCDEFGCSSFDLSEVADNAKMEISEGIVYKDNYEEVANFEGYFRKWRKLQTTVFLTVEAPKDKADAIKAAIKTAGGKVAR